ncbi:MAG: hypothetical protein ACJA1A_003538 [Saprospiraceae bacterium]|jgi:hypothetical protein
MKQLSFVLSLIIIPFLASSQIDKMWYVKNKATIDSGSYLPQASAFTEVEILNVAHPDPDINSDGSARNDIFIMYTDGTHTNTRMYSELDWIDYDSGYIPPVSTPDLLPQNYFVHTNSGIAFMYFTNVYEGNEEPTARVAPPSSGGSSLNFPLWTPNSTSRLEITTPAQTLTANHSPARGKDYTIIIKATQQMLECKYNLCFNNITPNPEYEREKSSSNVEISAYPFYSNISVYQQDNGNLEPRSDLSAENGCISDIDFPEVGYTYVNLRIPSNLGDEYLEGELSVTLETNESCPSVNALVDTVRNSHDPNYILVMCVDTMKDYNIVKYRAECMNDGNAPQDDPSMEFTFPFPVGQDSIIITKSAIYKSGDLNQIYPVCRLNNNRVKFCFDGKLDNCGWDDQRPECKAWVEFCVKVRKKVNVISDDLQPFNRNTNFGEDVYAIEMYIDPCDSKDPNREKVRKEKSSLESPNFNIDDYAGYHYTYDPNCEREAGSCDCKCKKEFCNWKSFNCCGEFRWMYIGIIGLILFGLLFFGSRSFRKG